MLKRKRLEKEIFNLDQVIHTAHLKTKALALKARQVQNTQIESAITEYDLHERGTKSIAEDFLSTAINQATVKIVNEIRYTGLDTKPWTISEWGNIAIPTRRLPPSCIRIGTLISSQITSQLPEIPALLPLIGANHILVFHPRQLVEEGSRMITSIAWRIIASTSPEYYRFILIDTIDRGRNFASFLNLPEAVRGDKIYCQPREIEEILQNEVNEMENVIQRRLRESFDSIEEYNSANPHTHLPYHFIFFTAIPDGFNDQMMEHIQALARTGTRAGYYFVGGVFFNETQIHISAIEKLLDHVSCLYLNQPGQAQWDDPLFAHMPINPDEPPTKDLSLLLSYLVEDEIQNVSNIVEFAQIAPEITDWMRMSTQSGLKVPVGLDENGNIFYIELGPNKDAFHALIGGRTHSGKTNFLHAFILSLCLTYSEDELHLYLVDFKEGVEFQDYDLHQLPHARAIVVEAEREFGLSVLEFLDDEMERRSDLFKRAGGGVVNIEGYRAVTKKSMPRIVAILDEFVKMFEEDDIVSDKAYQTMLRIVQRSRAFGIHLILAAQRPVGNFQSLNSIKSQIGLRIAFKCNEPDDSTLILGERNEKAAYLERNGLAYITYDPTMPKVSQQVKISFVNQEDRKLYLTGIRKVLSEENKVKKWGAIVFRKWEPAYWNDCSRVIDILAGQPISNPILWLGQPVRLDEDQTITSFDQEGDNLLIVGLNDQLVFQFLIHSILSLGMTCDPDTTEYFWISALSNYPDAHEYLNLLDDVLPHAVEICQRDSIKAIFDEIVYRLDHRQENNINAPKIFLFIPGIHRISEFREPDLGEKLDRILSEGPRVGINVILWTNRFDILRELTSYSVLDHFNHRVVYHVGVDDSNTILGVSDASRLGMDHRFLYRNQNWAERSVDKIKPYQLVGLSIFTQILADIKLLWEKQNE